jgi:general secretion pathway protein D
MKTAARLFASVALLFAATAPASVTLNLKDADIATLIATVSEVTGKNFIVDTRVKGKVTVISSKPMSAAGVYETFLGVLQVNGFAVIPDGQAYKIVPEANAKQDGGVRTHSGRGLPIDDVVTYVHTPQNVSAPQLVPILRALMPQWAHLAAYAPGNQLIISDRAANVQRMIELIDRMDQSSDRSVDIVKLANASAAEVVRTLTALTSADKAQDPTIKPAAVIADERSNSVLIGGDKAERVRLLSLIKQLDLPLDQGGSTQVVYLRYASAENLAPILEGYAQQVNKAGAAGGAAPAGGNAPAAGGGQGHQRPDHHRAAQGHAPAARCHCPARHPARPGAGRGGHRRSQRQQAVAARRRLGRVQSRPYRCGGALQHRSFLYRPGRRQRRRQRGGGPGAARPRRQHCRRGRWR